MNIEKSIHEQDYGSYSNCPQANLMVFENLQNEDLSNSMVQYMDKIGSTEVSEPATSPSTANK